MRPIQAFSYTLLVVLLAVSTGFAQTGKIVGTVTDGETGDPLPGVNVVIEGTTQGATTNGDGYYAILNVSPGNYTLRATFVGYTSQVVEDVEVNINLTTKVAFELQEETVGLDEVVIQSQEPVVKPDVSANVANLSADNFKNLPVSSVESLVGMQAGVQGLSVRGGDLNEVNFMVDGQSMREGRDNTPFTGVSYTSIQEVQVQTGGFNAEYGNVRSGLINVVTKDPPRNRYMADVLGRYSPPSQDHFGPKLDDREAFHMRPFVDPEVAFVGTDSEESPWDTYTQNQYPTFEGWNSVAERTNNDDNPNNDLTPEQWQQVFEHYHRKDPTVEVPDYTIDGTVGGPVPGLNASLGNLRFLASYRRTQDAFLIPQRREAYEDWTGRLNIAADLARGIKLELQGMLAEQLTMNPTSYGGASMFTGDNMHYYLSGGDNRAAIEFALDKYSLMDVSRNMIGIDFTHTLGPNTFYEIKGKRMSTDYLTRPGPLRDTSTVVKTIGEKELTEAPFGMFPWANITTITNFMMGGLDNAVAYDSSDFAVWSATADITSQLNRHSQLKAGVTYILTEHNVNHRTVKLPNPYMENPVYKWSRQPRQGAAYVQNKLEFEGLVANLGVRLDYFDAGGQWYAYGPFERAFSVEAGFHELSTALEKTDTDPKLAVSPRLGISFPVTTGSKLYFNYGHFRQMLDPNSIFMLRGISTGAVSRIGNPNHPMPQTIAYELGYEHNVFDRFLIRLSGYYKDISEQSRSVNFESADGYVNYDKPLPLNYESIRGFEATLNKVRGQWIRGFVNFTYMSTKYGNFGFGEYHENPVDQREYERLVRNYQNSPVPQPYARINLEIISPPSFGPEMFGGRHPLGNWGLSWLGAWQSGDVFTWTGGPTQQPIENNVRWADSWSLDMRLTKNVTTPLGDAQLFADISNVLNLKQMNRASAFLGNRDYERYMKSLHLPKDTFEDLGGSAPYAWIPGSDEPGDYRPEDVEFVPIEVVGRELPAEGVSRTQGYYGPLYYVKNESEYYVWEGGSWTEAKESKVEQVLDDKAYIDMPNRKWATFLNPRQIMFGLRVTL